MKQILNEVKQSSSSTLIWAWPSSTPACFFLLLHIGLVYVNINLSSLVQDILTGSLTSSVLLYRWSGYHASESLQECPRMFYNIQGDSKKKARTLPYHENCSCLWTIPWNYKLFFSPENWDHANFAYRTISLQFYWTEISAKQNGGF